MPDWTFPSLCVCVRVNGKLEIGFSHFEQPLVENLYLYKYFANSLSKYY